MRKLLKESLGIRSRYSGTVKRFGTKRSYHGMDLLTILLSDVKNNKGTIVTDHLWFTVGKQLKTLNPQIGQRIEFNARVDTYVKGYQGRREDVYIPVEIDYRLSYPSKFEIIVEPTEQTL